MPVHLVGESLQLELLAGLLGGLLDLVDFTDLVQEESRFLLGECCWCIGERALLISGID